MVETSIQQMGDVTVVVMKGRLRLGNSLGYAENTINRLIEAGTRKLVIDLSGVESIDSSGLGMLIYCGGRMEQTGGCVRIAGAVESVARVFEISHAARVLQMDPDVALACRHLSAEA